MRFFLIKLVSPRGKVDSETEEHENGMQDPFLFCLLSIISAYSTVFSLVAAK